MLVRTLKILIFLIISSCIVACVPSAARPPIQLQGDIKDMVSAAVETCPTITTLGYNYMSIEATGDSFVSCRASAITGVAILGLLGGVVSPDLRLNVAFSESGNGLVSAYISSVPRNTEIEDALESALRHRFASSGGL